jgi:DNA-binding NarL/FixJ family response regulator
LVVRSTDHVLRDGVTAQFRGRSEVVLAQRSEVAQVGVVVADELDREALTACRCFLRTDPERHVVVVVSKLDDRALLEGYEAGASGFVRRREAAPERLVAVVLAVARGEVTVPPDLVGGILTHLSRLQSGDRGGTLKVGLSPREADVLRLASQGLETSEIALRLSYSERTVKGVVRDITTRLQLRNRTHAVAYAVKHGLI